MSFLDNKDVESYGEVKVESISDQNYPDHASVLSKHLQTWTILGKISAL